MTKYLERLPLQPQLDAKSSAWRFFIILLLGFFVGQFVGLLTIVPFIGFDEAAINAFATDPSTFENGRMLSWLMQTAYSVTCFIVVPLGVFTLLDRQPLRAMAPEWKLGLMDVGMVLLLMLAGMVVLEPVIEWNKNLSFPGGLSAFESWARETEAQLAQQTAFLTQMDGIGDILLVSLLIAVIPAIGEELAFRGLLQNYIHKASGNAHVAIWLSALAFSAIHLQFLGFFPRLLLGVIFGYLLVWSGRLWVPILAHFLNNFITVLLVYGKQHSTTQEHSTFVEQYGYGYVLLALVVFAGLAFVYWRHYHRRSAI